MPLRQRMLSSIFLIVIVLAIIGLGTSLIMNPKGLITTLLIGLGIAFLLFLGLQFFLNKRNSNSSDEMKKYNAAVKQSNQKYSKQPVKSADFPVIKKTNRSKRRGHLTVIQGKKSNDK